MKNKAVFWITLSALLLVAFMLRIHALETVPPGLTHDEAGNGHDAAAVLRGVLNLYFPIGYGREPLYTYSVALLTAVLGQSIFTLRVTTVLWSLLTWILIVAMARRWWGNRAALLVGALLTCSFWPLMVARVGLRAPTLPPLFTASVLAYDHALQAHRSSNLNQRQKPGTYYLLSGLFLGLSLYTYMASRGMPLIYIAFLIWAGLLNRPILHKAWWGTLLLVAVALIIATPLFLHLRAHPELEYRLTQLSGPIEALKKGNWQPLWHNVTASLPMLGWQGDPLWLYNISGRPALEALPAAAFWFGVVNALVHLRDPHNALLLLWAGAGLAPAFITGPEATALRAIAALPAVYLLATQGLNTLYKRIDDGVSAIDNMPSIAGMVTLSRRGIKTGITIILSLSLLFTGAEATSAYFRRWGEHHDVRVLYLHHLVALGRALDPPSEPDAETFESNPIVITTIYPGEYHDPYTMEVVRSFDCVQNNLRWVNGNGALFFPQGETTVYTETLSAPHPILRTLLLDHASLKKTLTFHPDDLISAIYGYRWASDTAWAEMLTTLSNVVYVAPGDPSPASPHYALRGPILYDNALSMAGYRIAVTENVPTGQNAKPGKVKPGDKVGVLSAWVVQAIESSSPGSTSIHHWSSTIRQRFPTFRRRSPTEATGLQLEELVLFTHLLDPEGTIISQADRLDAPSWQWKAGDRFAQIHELMIPAETPPGSYWLAIGLYRREDLNRMPVNLQLMQDHNDSDTLKNLTSAPITRVLLPLEVSSK
jgi:4-amino-4-deoxy-L-arabinose transferase-like glycosyltransferase